MKATINHEVFSFREQHKGDQGKEAIKEPQKHFISER